MTLTRVFIATTEGPSEVQSISEEDPAVRSVVCLDGKANALPISAAYDGFVRQPTGVIERDFGHAAFRVDVADPISSGLSWQLGLYAAHLLLASGRLAHSDAEASEFAWLSGEVDRNLNVHPVSGISKKIKNSTALLSKVREAGTPITFFLAEDNVEDAKELLGESAAVVGVSSISDLKTHFFGEDSQPNVQLAKVGEGVNRSLTSSGSGFGRKIRCVAIAIALLLGFGVVSLAAIWNGGFADFRQYLEQENFEQLNGALKTAEEKCFMCSISARVFKYSLALNRPSSGFLKTRVESKRMPNGARCLSFVRSNLKLESRIEVKNPDGDWQLQQDGSICILNVGFELTEKFAGGVWVGILKDIGNQNDQNVLPRFSVQSIPVGGTASRMFELKVPRYVQAPITHQLITVATDKGVSKKLETWLEKTVLENRDNLSEPIAFLQDLGFRVETHKISVRRAASLKRRFQ